MSGHVSPKGTYYAIFGSLMVLTAVTVAVAFLEIGVFNFPVAISIAIFKASLVILFFMHAKYSSRLTKLIIGSAFFFLFVLLGLTLSDYLSRGWHTRPGGSTGPGTAQYGVDGRPIPVGAPAPGEAPTTPAEAVQEN
jgi:cytochrome c oxidase subunit IV